MAGHSGCAGSAPRIIACEEPELAEEELAKAIDAAVLKVQRHRQRAGHGADRHKAVRTMKGGECCTWTLLAELVALAIGSQSLAVLDQAVRSHSRE